MEQTATAATKATHVRYTIVLMLFVASTFSYGDRVVLSIAAADISRDLHLDALRLGYLFSAFSWAYAAAQLPAGSLLDRFGSKQVYGVSIICWSCCGLLSGFAGYAPVAAAFYILHSSRIAASLRTGPIARFPRQRTHRGRMVSCR